MEQSIKSVLVKQTIAHQQQQLSNLQVKLLKNLGNSIFKLSMRVFINDCNVSQCECYLKDPF